MKYWGIPSIISIVLFYLAFFIMDKSFDYIDYWWAFPTTILLIILDIFLIIITWAIFTKEDDLNSEESEQ